MHCSGYTQTLLGNNVEILLNCNMFHLKEGEGYCFVDILKASGSIIFAHVLGHHAGQLIFYWLILIDLLYKESKQFFIH